MTARQLHRVLPIWPADAPSVSASSWQDLALCAQSDPEAWFPENGCSTAYAKRVCRACPVTDECLQFALDNDERFGVWGGLSERQRRKLKNPPIRLAPGEKRCRDCDQVKPISDFHRNGLTGYRGTCADCRNAGRGRAAA